MPYTNAAPRRWAAFIYNLLYPVTLHQSLILLAIPPSYALLPYQVLDTHKPVEDRLGPRGTAGYIHIHRNHLVDTLQYGISIEDTPAAGACAHRHHPTRLGHLQVYLLDHRPHLLGNRAHNHQQITLPRAETQPLGTKTSQIIMAGHRSHKLDPATRRSKRHRPKGVFTPQPHDLAQRCSKKTLAHIPLRHIGDCYTIFNISLYRMNIKSNRTCHNYYQFKFTFFVSSPASAIFDGLNRANVCAFRREVPSGDRHSSQCKAPFLII